MEITGPQYPPAQFAARRVYPRFAQVHEAAQDAAIAPDAGTIEELIDAAFWASLRREEGYAPKISLAYLPPDRAGASLSFASALHLNPESLTRLAPAAE